MSVTLHTTHGDIKLELHCNLVPRPSYNFLALCARNSFSNIPFHRVIRDYIIQTGDPTGLGTVSDAAIGNKTKKWRRLPDEIVPELTFDDAAGGVVAFAGGGKPSKRGVGSQFFITCSGKKATHLNGTCTIVGRVLHGMHVVDHIANVDVDQQYRPIGRHTEKEKADSEEKEKDDDGDDHNNNKFDGMPKIICVTVHANPFAMGLVHLPAD